MRLSDYVTIKQRFSRSANVERDVNVGALDGYLLTGRALDVLSRVARGLMTPSAGRSFAITGPHGGGKSSLAVFLNAAFAPPSSAEYSAARRILQATDSEVSEQFAQGLKRIDPCGMGSIRAFATAAHEPVTVTVARALFLGARRALGASQDLVPVAFGDEHAARTLTVHEMRGVVEKLCALRPVVLVLDEFGKNLEAYAASGSQGDPYLLQWLAEAGQGETALPLVLITMQHLAFDEYAEGASVTRRREWAKVQGRFHDIPYVEAAREARRLIAAAVQLKPGQLKDAVDCWYECSEERFAAAGLRDLWANSRSCYPLHPLVVAALPELCSRYGQNERTLFSFLAGTEPLAIPAFLQTAIGDIGNEPPFVGLDRCYDYFLDSSGAMIGASANASRWVEIETRIRDTTGLNDLQMRVLKSIGVLNLVSSSGTLRASRSVLDLTEYSAREGLRISGQEITGQLLDVLSELEHSGLITYRDYADDYRIWQGSDFNIEAALASARALCSSRGLAELLNEAAPLEPAVAGRHSQRTGVLRIFERRFSDLKTGASQQPANELWDGTVLYATVGELPDVTPDNAGGRPVVVVLPESVEPVRKVAVEAAAFRMALTSAEADQADWVARRELIERVADAEKALRDEVGRTWGPANSKWHLIGHGRELPAREGISAALSRAADIAYCGTPRIANEMISRRELTSQGAKARRMLIEAFLASPEEEKFGIEGYGPDRAMYEAVYRATGIHRRDRETGRWAVGEPTAKPWARAWAEIASAFKDAKTRRVSLEEICSRLKRPPVGLKDGILPILLVTALVMHASEIALYEHGSLLLTLDDAVAERLARNPEYFTIKNSAAESGARRVVVTAIAGRLLSTRSVELTFLQVVRSLYKTLQSLPPFTQQTHRYVSGASLAVRQAFRTALEPDSLMFEKLPAVLRYPAFPADGPIEAAVANGFAADLGQAIQELQECYKSLLRDVWDQLASATSTWGEPSEIRAQLAAQARSLDGRVLEPRLGAFVTALTRPLDGDAWIENVAMVVADGQSPRTWTDGMAERFGLMMADIGGGFRRVRALLYERLAASDGGYGTRRLTVTTPDGNERSQVITISDPDRAVVIRHVGPVVDQLSEIFGSRAAACQMLLAHLATEDMQPPAPADAESPVAKEA